MAVMAGRRKTATKARDGGRALIYLRVSTQEQALSGLGIEAQLHAARMAVDARGWTITDVIEDRGVSASPAPPARPGLGAAIERLCTGEADVLVAAKLDRLSRSTIDLLGRVDKAE